MPAHACCLVAARLSPALLPLPPCSAAMSAFYVWNLLLFKPSLPAAKQH